MKKITSIVLFIVSLSVHANDLVYCPEVIQCTDQRCDFEQDNNNYWSAISNLCDPEKIPPGEYRASYVSAPYHAEQGGYAICVYTHTEIYKTLMLRARVNAGLVIFEDEQSKWRPEESWGECRPEPLSACPLQSRLP